MEPELCTDSQNTLYRHMGSSSTNLAIGTWLKSSSIARQKAFTHPVKEFAASSREKVVSTSIFPSYSWRSIDLDLFPSMITYICSLAFFPAAEVYESKCNHFRSRRISCCCKTEIEEFQARTSADEVRKEILKCYELVNKLGRGAVYLGSARTKPDHPHFLQATELGREVALLLNCTSWTGVGPGMMDAATKGAMQARKPVAGFKINNEAGIWTDTGIHPYMPPESFLTCRFFSARKHGLVDAGVRNSISDKTAFFALPGGIGTMDEVFEILTLLQLSRIGSKYPVPFLAMNYDGFFDKLFEFFATCKQWGTIVEGEIEALWKVCDNNADALKYLCDFYNISE